MEEIDLNPDITEEMRVQIVKDAVRDLNTALWRAEIAGLRVDLDIIFSQSIDVIGRHTHVSASVSKVL